MNDFLKAMEFRHACKKFDPEQKISDADFRQILEFARLSPSSYGLEQWRFIVVQRPELRERLRIECWDQPQITDSSHVVVILARTAAVQPGTEYVKQHFSRWKLADHLLKDYLNIYTDYHENEVLPYMNTYAWSAKQCYIALANMMTGAASMGIDSCPMEGFSKTAVEQVLGVDTAENEVAVIVTFGYRLGEQTPRFRQDLDELVEYQ